MKALGGGSIINMSSVGALLGYPIFFAYSAAKGAVRSMTKSIAVHCQMNKYNVRCNAIAPTARTRMTEELLGPLAPLLDIAREAQPRFAKIGRAHV